MAIIKQGILGGFSGKVGSVVGTSWKGRAVMKALPLSVANPRTTPQVNQRNAFSSCVKFASEILATLIIALMNRFAGDIAGYNKFTSLNVGLFNEDGLQTPANLSFGTGKLGETAITVVDALAGVDTMQIEWDPILDNSFKANTDKPYFLVVNRNTQKIIIQGVGGNDRSIGGESFLAIETFNAGNILDCYLVFLRADGTQVGNTAYFQKIASA
jgi:hypothetical protein